MSRPNPIVQRIKDRIDEIKEMLKLHAVEKLHLEAEMDQLGRLLVDDPAPKRTRKKKAAAETPLLTDPQMGKASTESVSEPQKATWTCSQGHKFEQPGQQKMKGGKTVPCCPVPDCGDLDIQQLE